MDESLGFFVKLQGPSRTLRRFITAFPEWARRPLDNYLPRSQPIQAIRDLIEFGPYLWGDTWLSLQNTWEVLTRQWPTLIVLLDLVVTPNGQEVVGFLPTVWRLRIHQGQSQIASMDGAVAAERFRLDARHCLGLDDIPSMPYLMVVPPNLPPDLDFGDGRPYDEDALDYPEYLNSEDAALEGSRAWRAWAEKRRVIADRDDDEIWMDQVNQLQDEADQDLNPMPWPEEELLYLDNEDDVEMPGDEEEAVSVQSPGQNAADKDGENPDSDEQAWKWPDDLPF